MKYILIGLCLLSNIGILTAQNADSRVLSYFGSPKINEWQTQAPDSILFWNYFVQKGFEVIEDVPRYKLSQLQDISELKLNNSNQTLTEKNMHLIDRLLMESQLNLPYYKAGLYRIGTSGKVLVFVARHELDIRYKSSSK